MRTTSGYPGISLLACVIATTLALAVGSACADKAKPPPKKDAPRSSSKSGNGSGGNKSRASGQKSNPDDSDAVPAALTTGNEPGQSQLVAVIPPSVTPITDAEKPLVGAAPPSGIRLPGTNSCKQADNNLWRFDLTKFETHLATEKNPEWCWAACTQMVLDYHGIQSPQESIVARIKQIRLLDKENDGASMADICNALQADYPRPDGRVIKVRVFPYVATMHELVNDLYIGEPLLVCLNRGQGNGHVCVIVGATISFRARNPFDLATDLRTAQHSPFPPPPEPGSKTRQFSFGAKGFKESKGNNVAAIRPGPFADHAFDLQLGSGFEQAVVLLHDVKLIDPDPDLPNPHVTLSGQELKDQVLGMVRMRVVR